MGLPIKSPLSTGVCELADALGSEPCLPAQANHNDADGQVKVHMNWLLFGFIVLQYARDVCDMHICVYIYLFVYLVNSLVIYLVSYLVCIRLSI